MIRLIGRTLIIPRGDTGSFTIPTLSAVVEGDIAVFSIYDPLYQKTIHEHIIPIDSEILTINLFHEDTADLEASERYQWDIKIYHEPEFDEYGTLKGGTCIDSYFAAYGKSMPQCIVRQISQDVYKTNRERTRDRLLGQDTSYTTTSTSVLYPTANTNLNILSNQLYQLAKKGGYSGTNQDFYKYFGLYLEQNKQEIIFANWDEFPEEGQSNKFYFNLLDSTLYYWKDGEYQPVNAMLIDDIIIEGGGA